MNELIRGSELSPHQLVAESMGYWMPVCGGLKHTPPGPFRLVERSRSCTEAEHVGTPSTHGLGCCYGQPRSVMQVV